MIKKTVKSVDFNGEPYEEDLYFNLNQMELVSMMGKYGGDLPTYLQNIVRRNDTNGIVEFLKDLINISYGEKSSDGKIFNKSIEVTNNFINSSSYEAFFMDLLNSSEDQMFEFVKGLFNFSKEEEEEINKEYKSYKVKKEFKKNKNDKEEAIGE